MIFNPSLPSHTLLHESRDATSGDDLGDLPEWDLTHLYPAPDCPEIATDLDWLKGECAAFANDYENRLSALPSRDMLECIQRYEKIASISGRISSFAQLRVEQMATDATRSKFLSDMQEQITHFHTALVFFNLEMTKIEDVVLDAMLADNKELARYKPVLERMRAWKPYQLSDELEKHLHDKSVVGATAWRQLYSEVFAALEFHLDGTVLNQSAILNLLSDPDRSTRQKAAQAFAKTLGQNIRLTTRITNTLAKEKEIEDRWRKLPTPQSARHLENHVEPEVVKALRDAVVAAYPRLSHRYYTLKAKWLGLEYLEIWDRHAPLPGAGDKTIPWLEARKLVSEAYCGFSVQMAELTEPFFTRGWIDAGVKPGKAAGAFAHPTVTDAHPYILLNYLGKQRDVMTLAHELGHGVHQVLASSQGELLSPTPLTIAETASVFGEMLTFRKLLDAAPDQAHRKHLLAGKVQDMIDTVVRQISFYDFECKLHAARAKGELTPDQINDIWLAVQHESLGPAFKFMDGYETFWSYIPHFINAPFYVYAYAFGDGLVNALYAVYEEGDPDFEAKYFDMLRAGGSRHHSELLAPFSLDASNPKFWDKGLSLISSMIDELEAMET